MPQNRLDCEIIDYNVSQIIIARVQLCTRSSSSGFPTAFRDRCMPRNDRVGIFRPRIPARQAVTPTSSLRNYIERQGNQRNLSIIQPMVPPYTHSPFLSLSLSVSLFLRFSVFFPVWSDDPSGRKIYSKLQSIQFARARGSLSCPRFGLEKRRPSGPSTKLLAARACASISRAHTRALPRPRAPTRCSRVDTRTSSAAIAPRISAARTHATAPANPSRGGESGVNRRRRG